MQAIIETLFDVCYLVSVITIGIRMVKSSKNSRQFKLFGWMAIVLGAGDSFHLIPRMIALCTTGLENFTVALGLGKWITSVTMTLFYVLLYYVWRERYEIKGQKNLTIAVYLDVDDNCIELWFLHSSSIMGGYNSNDWHADDP